MGRAALFLQAILISGALAQPVTLQIITPSERVTAGDTIALSAVGVAGDGSIQPQKVSWSVDQPTIASIDSAGNLTGITLGIVRVTAQLGNLLHDTEIQVVPHHTIIRPALAKILIGEQRQFTATAYDKNNQPIPGVNFTWALTSTNADDTPRAPIGTISQTGLLTGGSEGMAYVRAMFTYYQPAVYAGMEMRIPVYAQFVVSAPRPFEVTRLFDATTEPRQNPTLRPRPSPLWTLPGGSILFNASLDGVGAALLAWDGTAFHTVVSAGTSSNSPGSIVSDLGRHSITANGNLMIQQNTSDGGLVLIWDDVPLRPLLVTNTSAAGMESLFGFNLTRNSRASSGSFIFNGWYRLPGTSIYTYGLFRGSGNNVNEVLVSQLDQLPELGNQSGAGLYDYGIDNNGVTWYVASAQGQQVIYRHDAVGRQKFLATGDPFQGSTIQGFNGNRNSTPAYLWAENGDVLFSVTLQDGRNFMLRYTGTDPTQPAAALRVNFGTAALAYANDGTALIYGDPYPNKGDGAWLWKGDSVQPVALIGKTLVNGQPIQSIESGAMDADGLITLMVATADNPMVVIRAAAGSDPQVLFKSGDPVGLTGPSVIEGFVSGGRTGNPLLMVGSMSNAAIAQWGNGDVQPLLSPGDRILGAGPFPGVNPWGSTQQIANGDLYTTLPGVGIAHYSNGQWDTALKFPIKLDDGATANPPYRIAVNNAGAILWITGTNQRDTRLYVTQNGQNQLICSNGLASKDGAVINGEAIYSCDSFYPDDLGRVVVQVHMQNDPTQRTYVWNQGAWQLAVQPYKTQIGGRTVNNVSLIRAMGPHLYATLQTDVGTYITEWIDSGWSVLYGANDPMPTGFPLGSVWNYLEANTNGDMVFVSQSFPNQAVYYRRNGVLSTVLTTGRRTDAGDFLVTILGLDLKNDGTIYLLALNEKDELVLYSATPL